MNFYEVPFNFDTAHMKRGKPSKPVIPPAAIFEGFQKLRLGEGQGAIGISTLARRRA